MYNIYIYIYIYCSIVQYNTVVAHRKGTNGVSTNGVTANLMFFDRDFSGTPVNLLLSSQKCQGVSFSPNLSTLITFAAAPLMLTPFVRNQLRRESV